MLAFSSIEIVQAKPIKNISPHQAHKMIANVLSNPNYDLYDLLIIDIQPFEMYTAGHIPGAYNVPTDQLTWWIATYGQGFLNNKHALIIVSNTDGSGSPIAAGILSDIGFKKVYNMEGGVVAWIDTGYEPETGIGPPLPPP
jgi:rhodanese-related sulfurtransferase